MRSAASRKDFAVLASFTRAPMPYRAMRACRPRYSCSITARGRRVNRVLARSALQRDVTLGADEERDPRASRSAIAGANEHGHAVRLLQCRAEDRAIRPHQTEAPPCDEPGDQAVDGEVPDVVPRPEREREREHAGEQLVK